MAFYPKDNSKKVNPNYIPPASTIPCLKMEWISAKDNLPEDGKMVVAYSTVTRRASCCNCLKSYVELYGNYDEVTHWFPLPEFPSGK